MKRFSAVLLLCACGPAQSVPAVKPAAPPAVAADDDNATSPPSDEVPHEAKKPAERDGPQLQLTASGLGIVDVRPGNGAEAHPGQHVVVHYVGRLESGKEFDSSRARGIPFEFELGAGKVIAGWDEGIEGMRVGGLRKLIVPPAMAYGARGHPPEIPPDAVLEFVVELLEVR